MKKLTPKTFKSGLIAGILFLSFDAAYAQKKELGVLFMGHTGVGKSSTINTFYNVVSKHYELNQEPGVIIPYWRYNRSVPVNIEQFKHNAPTLYAFRQGQTKETRKFVAQNDQYIVNLYDTPGFGDPDGSSTTQKNTRSQILKTLSKNKIHAIVIVQKNGDQNRLTPEMKSWISESLSMLPKSARPNIYGAYTFSTRLAEFFVDDLQNNFISDFKLDNGILALENSWLFSEDSQDDIYRWNSKQITEFLDNLSSQKSALKGSDFRSINQIDQNLESVIDQTAPEIRAYIDQVTELSLVEENLRMIQQRIKENKDYITMETFVYPEGVDNPIPEWVKVLPEVLKYVPLPPEYEWVKVVIPVVLKALTQSGSVKYHTQEIPRVNEVKKNIFDQALKDETKMIRLIDHLGRSKNELYQKVRQSQRLIKSEMQKHSGLAFSVSSDPYLLWLGQEINRAEETNYFEKVRVLKTLTQEYRSL